MLLREVKLLRKEVAELKTKKLTAASKIANLDDSVLKIPVTCKMGFESLEKDVSSDIDMETLLVNQHLT